MTRIPTATPRDAPSVDCLGMGRAQGLVFLATSGAAATDPETEHMLGRVVDGR
jgi:hypothetical protein